MSTENENAQQVDDLNKQNESVDSVKETSNVSDEINKVADAPAEEKAEQTNENSVASEKDSNKELEEATKKIKYLEEQVKALNDEKLRAIAEMQNVQRRAANEIDKARKFSISSFANDLVPALEPMEKAVEYSEKLSQDVSQETSQMVAGLKSTMSLLLKAMEQNGVKQIRPASGDEFDPNKHDAATFIPNADVPANHIIEVFRTGYELNGRVIRAAQVIVSAGNGAKIETQA